MNMLPARGGSSSAFFAVHVLDFSCIIIRGRFESVRGLSSYQWSTDDKRRRRSYRMYDSGCIMHRSEGGTCEDQKFT